MCLQLDQRPGGEVGAGVNAEPLHLRRGDRPDAVKALHRERRDECRPLVWRDDANAVGLVLIARQFGDKLAIAHPGGGG